MFVKQISVFVENTRGALSKVTGILAENGINIRALSIADTTDFGILRLIVQDPYKAETVLKANDIAVKSTDVIAVAISDRPSGLHDALAVLRDADVTVEYMYAFVCRSDCEAYVIVKTDNPETALGALKSGGVKVLSSNDVYEL
ncbi:MAG: ACT domain-containing protein [Ruminococcaceae bacterium]|nr:ACT domain-containing protein [Oscillospiraceae bacterium]